METRPGTRPGGAVTCSCSATIRRSNRRSCRPSVAETPNDPMPTVINMLVDARSTNALAWKRRDRVERYASARHPPSSTKHVGLHVRDLDIKPRRHIPRVKEYRGAKTPHHREIVHGHPRTFVSGGFALHARCNGSIHCGSKGGGDRIDWLWGTSRRERVGTEPYPLRALAPPARADTWRERRLIASLFLRFDWEEQQLARSSAPLPHELHMTVLGVT